MIALCIPVWNRLEFTRLCLESFQKYTNMELVSKVVIYDNNSIDGTSEFCNSFARGNGYEYYRGTYESSWEGFNDLYSTVAGNSDFRFIGKVDNDVLFTRPWIEEIIDSFNADKRWGSIRYGASMSKGDIYPVKDGGKHGGLKIIKKTYAREVLSDRRWAGSIPISFAIEMAGKLNGIIGVGVKDLNREFPEIAKEYEGKNWQRPYPLVGT